MGKDQKDVHEDIPISKILEGIHRSNVWSAQQEGMLKNVMDQVAAYHKGSQAGNIVGPDGQAPQVKQLPDRFLLELLLEAVRLLLQSERIMRLGMGTILDARSNHADQTMTQAATTISHIRKAIRAGKTGQAVWLCDGVLRHWNELKDKQEQAKPGKLGDEGGSQSPDLKQDGRPSAECRLHLVCDCNDHPGSGPQGSQPDGSPVTTPAPVNPLSDDGTDAT